MAGLGQGILAEEGPGGEAEGTWLLAMHLWRTPAPPPLPSPISCPSPGARAESRGAWIQRPENHSKGPQEPPSLRPAAAPAPAHLLYSGFSLPLPLHPFCPCCLARTPPHCGSKVTFLSGRPDPGPHPKAVTGPFPLPHMGPAFFPREPSCPPILQPPSLHSPSPPHHTGISWSKPSPPPSPLHTFACPGPSAWQAFPAAPSRKHSDVRSPSHFPLICPTERG